MLEKKTLFTHLHIVKLIPLYPTLKTFFNTKSNVNRQESGYITEVSSHIFVHVIGLFEGKNSQHEQVKVTGVSCPSCHAQSNRMNFNFSFQYPKLLLWLLAFLLEVLSGLKKLPQKQEF